MLTITPHSWYQGKSTGATFTDYTTKPNGTRNGVAAKDAMQQPPRPVEEWVCVPSTLNNERDTFAYSTSSAQ